jgi:hypothetical protein
MTAAQFVCVGIKAAVTHGVVRIETLETAVIKQRHAINISFLPVTGGTLDRRNS